MAVSSPSGLTQAIARWHAIPPQQDCCLAHLQDVLKPFQRHRDNAHI